MADLRSANTRLERDSMGEMPVPAEALYGASTARAIENFPIAHRPLPCEVIHAFGHLKAACAKANRDLGRLDAARADAIIAAAEEVAVGRHDAHFPVDVYQTGSGTSTNMNANEVIATLANQRLGQGATPGSKLPGVHPNDHVNSGQSSNDAFPTAMHIAAADAVAHRLIPALGRLAKELDAKAAQWDHIVKVGRTHTMDATPIRVGQVFSGYAAAAHYAVQRATQAYDAMRGNLPIGGAAVGTGINTHPDFARKVCEHLEASVKLPFREAANHYEAQAAKDSFVDAHGLLKTIAISLGKIASDIRLLGSGPRCGVGELVLPATQPGSSIMPGKVNPVICESVVQVQCRVIGNDAAIAALNLGGVGSIFELNVGMPPMVDAFLESVNLLANVTQVFIDKLLAGLAVDEARCRELLDRSLMTVTALAPALGYDVAARLAKRAMKENATIRAVVLDEGLMPAAELDALLDPDAMTRPKA